MKSNISKVMHKIANLPMIDYSINLAQKFSNNSVVVSRQEALDLNQHLSQKKINIAFQEQQLGTAHAVKSGLENINCSEGKVIILYGDTPFISEETIASLLAEKSCLTACFFKDEEPNRYGRAIIKSQKLTKITEYKDADEEYYKSNICNSGIMAVDAVLLKKYIAEIDNNNSSEEFYLTDLIEIFISKQLSIGYIIRDKNEFIGVNSRSELAHAELIMQKQLRLKCMNQGVTLIDPNSVYFAHDTIIGQDSIVEPHVFFGPGVNLGKYNIIRSFSYISETSSKEKVEIGPFAKLRGGSVLNNDVAIGSFVEGKKLYMDSGSKAKHLSYLGDCELGKNVNIGAGTITCNYDGKNKHSTQIGDNSFVGANVSLVAPLVIGNNCLLAAGSVIKQDCKDNEFAIARAKQQNKKNKY
jgi:bifunctional UDP-N-acetylglucosamine pyrophosphorylase/glucosamine-1-phosphate N-acetyltransferase